MSHSDMPVTTPGRHAVKVARAGVLTRYAIVDARFPATDEDPETVYRLQVRAVREGDVALLVPVGMVDHHPLDEDAVIGWWTLPWLTMVPADQLGEEVTQLGAKLVDAIPADVTAVNAPVGGDWAKIAAEHEGQPMWRNLYDGGTAPADGLVRDCGPLTVTRVFGPLSA